METTERADKKGFKNKLHKNIRQMAMEQYCEKPFDKEYFDLFLASVSLKYLFSGISIITGYFFVRSLFIDQIDSVTAVNVVTFIVLLSLETIKYFVTPKAFNRSLKKKWVDGIILFAVSLPIYSASIFISVKGMAVAFSNMDEKTNVITNDFKTDKDSLNNHYLEQIKAKENLVALLDNEYKETQTTLSKEIEKLNRNIAYLKDSVKVKTLSLSLAGLTNQRQTETGLYSEKRASLTSDIDQLKKDHKEALNLLNEKENLTLNNTTQKEGTTINRIMYIGFVSEILLFLCFAFSQYYMYMSYQGYLKTKKP